MLSNDKKNIFFFLLQLNSYLAYADNVGAIWSGVVNMGLTFGGDTLTTAQYTNGDSEDIDAGELFFFSGGVTATTGSFQAQATLGYYFDQANGSNGDVSFTRYPLDVLGFFKKEKYRVGGGITYHLSPELDIDIDGNSSNTEIEFDDALGLVIQGEYIFNERTTLGIRLTSIEYEESNFGEKVDGDSIGLVLGYLF